MKESLDHDLALSLHLLGNPVRLALVSAMAADEATLDDLARLCPNQPTLHGHLKFLLMGGLIERRREKGRRPYYRASPSGIARLFSRLAKATNFKGFNDANL